MKHNISLQFFLCLECPISDIQSERCIQMLLEINNYFKWLHFSLHSFIYFNLFSVQLFLFLIQISLWVYETLPWFESYISNIFIKRQTQHFKQVKYIVRELYLSNAVIKRKTSHAYSYRKILTWSFWKEGTKESPEVRLLFLCPSLPPFQYPGVAGARISQAQCFELGGR